MMLHRRLLGLSMAVIMLCSLLAVCASASVMAAVDKNITATGAPAIVGAAVPGGASACTYMMPNGVNELALFAKGTDNQLWWKNRTTQGTTWSSWKKLGGVLTSDPGAVNTQEGLKVYVRGADGALYMKASEDGGTTWKSWSKIGGYIYPGTGPSATLWLAQDSHDVKLAVLVTGGDRALWHLTSTSVWQRIGGVLTSSPAASLQPPGGLYAYVRGADGALWEYNASAAKWTTLSGYIFPGTGPAADLTQLGPDVVVTGGDHALWYRHKDEHAAVWQPWASAKGYLTSSPTMTAANPGEQVFVRGGDGALWTIAGTVSLVPPDNSQITWGGWSSIGGM